MRACQRECRAPALRVLKNNSETSGSLELRLQSAQVSPQPVQPKTYEEVSVCGLSLHCGL